MIFLNQAISLALIYIYRATCGSANMIGLDKAKEYKKAVNENLKKANSQIHYLSSDHLVKPDDLFFFYAEDRDENGYYVLKADEASIEKRKSYIKGLPFDVVLASQMPNALSVLGLELCEGQIIKKKTDVIRTRKNKDME